MTEHSIHKAIWQYLEYSLPHGWIVFHPNQNARSKVSAARAKALGFKAGIPDLIIIGPGGQALFAEVKTAKGRLSDPQKEFASYCDDWLVPHAVVRSVEDAEAFIREHITDVQGRVAA